jgi:hypothetical protein
VATTCSHLAFSLPLSPVAELFLSPSQVSLRPRDVAGNAVTVLSNTTLNFTAGVNGAGHHPANANATSLVITR